MIASDLSPKAMVFIAVCGTSSPHPDEEPTSTGLACWEYNMMIKVEFLVGQECASDVQCDQVIPVGDSCPTANRLLNIDFDARYLPDFIEYIESVDCTVKYPRDRGDCDPDAEPVCEMGTCTWM